MNVVTTHSSSHMFSPSFVFSDKVFIPLDTDWRQCCVVTTVQTLINLCIYMRQKCNWCEFVTVTFAPCQNDFHCLTVASWSTCKLLQSASRRLVTRGLVRREADSLMHFQ